MDERKEQKKKELDKYLQEVLQLNFPLYEYLHKHSEVEIGLYDKLDNLREVLRDCLLKIFPNPPGWEEIELIDLPIDWGKISDTNYPSRLFGLIKYVKTEGYLLEFIAAVHKRKSQNPYATNFIQRELKQIIQDLIPSIQNTEPLQTPQSAPTPLKRESATKTNSRSVKANPRKNGHSITQTVQLNSLAPLLEPESNTESAASLPLSEQNVETAPPTPLFSHKTTLEDLKQPSDLIAQAYKRIRDARAAIQSVQDAFQDDEDELIAQIILAQKHVKAISIPNYPGLYYRLPGKQKLFENISREMVFSLRAKQNSNSPPRFLQRTFEKLAKLLTILQKLEDFVRSYEQHLTQFGRESNVGSGNGK